MVGECDNQQKYKTIIEAAMVYTPDGLTGNSLMSSGLYVPVKQYNTKKSLRPFSEKLNVKPKTAVCKLCATKSKRKAIRAGNILCSSIQK